MDSKQVFKPKSWQVLRFEVFKRDGFQCVYCGAKAEKGKKTELHCDHVIPRCEGGKDEMRNLVTSCKDCNEGKWGRVLSKVLPTFSALLSATQRKKRALKRTLAELKKEEIACLMIEKEVQRMLSQLRPEQTEAQKKNGVIIRDEKPKPKRQRPWRRD